MISVLRVALIGLVMARVTSIWAAPPDAMGGPSMMGGGPPPGPVDAIKKAMNETQQRLVDLQWQLDAESEALGKLLSADHVDEAAVLAKLEQVTAIEQQVKKVNFALLVRIKNQLDAEQQAKLRALRPPHPFGPPGGPPPP